MGREGGGVEHYILIVGRGEEGGAREFVVFTAILENSCGQRNWSTRFTVDPLP